MPFALLIALAMLVLWSGVASAEDEEAKPSGTSCVLDFLLPECQPEREPGPVQPVHSEDEPLRAGEGIPAFTGPQPLPEQEFPSTSSTVDAPTDAPADDQQPPLQPMTGGGTPDLVAVGECLGEELALLVGGLQGSLDEGAEALLGAIEAGFDPANIADLPTFLEGLPTLVETTAPALAAELTELLHGVTDGVAVCLEGLVPEAPEQPQPAPPAVQPVAQPAVHYANCDDARARGAAPVYAGQAGYAAHLDNDGDGVGCEQEVALATHTPTASPQLAYTGFEVEPFLVAGAALIALGTLTVIGAARRT
ncbi:excalibur calcium-binding domain-containing protein [Blastococcus sp. LR1]|uniref:excalibur calcium-binding domain-containing protein n=1 Tax=Blastococcus sp. LR1 TaxID=2877000 RepID=UPI001CCE75A3|nr:excalibur calcium-binding domain-containing protein [Blastococcus sp. LR1]MCA0144995.1 excalibur calcium-binding domain-containing protein [Blastococcus sp. LR1]